MNYSNEENINTFQNNNRSLRPLNNNNNNETITKRKKKENNNPEIIEFKSQDNLVFVKNPRPIQNIKPYMATDKTKKQKQLYDSSNNYININKENQVTQQNKSNSSVKINTKVNSKKYFAKNNSKKINNQNVNEMNNKKEILNTTNNNITSNNFNIIHPGQNSIKIRGNKIINHFNNNKNNQLTMTKSSIQISGNYPLNQSQNIYYNQSKIESMELNIEGNSRGRINTKKNIENNESAYIPNKYTKNYQNYNNKTHLIKREVNSRMINYNNNDNYNNNNLSPIVVPTSVPDDNYAYYNNNSYINNNVKVNNFEKSTHIESDKNIQYGKNFNEYNNIFFYNSKHNNINNNNENLSFNDDKNNFHYRGNNDIINNDVDINEYKNSSNIIDKYSKVYSNGNINTNNIKDNKIKNKFVYKKSGNLSEKKMIKINSNKNNSQIKSNNSQNMQNIEQKRIPKNTKIDKNKIDIKSNIIINNKNDIKKNKEKDIFNYNKIYKEDNNNVIKNKDFNKNIIIRKMDIKNKLNNKYELVDFKLKIPNYQNLDKEETYTVNINKDDISETVEKIIKENSLDDDYLEPLLSLFNNSINVLKNINNMSIKKIKIDSQNNNSLLFNENNNDISSKENSDLNNLNYSNILDLIEKNKYKELIGEVYSDIDEINDDTKILNMSI
jgi:hypothetical protein